MEQYGKVVNAVSFTVWPFERKSSGLPVARYEIQPGRGGKIYNKGTVKDKIKTDIILTLAGSLQYTYRASYSLLFFFKKVCSRRRV